MAGQPLGWASPGERNALVRTTSHRSISLVLGIGLAASLIVATGGPATATSPTPPTAITTGGPSSSSDRDLTGSASKDSPGVVTVQAISAAPTFEIVDGIIRGNLNIRGAKDQPLKLRFLSSSKGGKLELGNVASGDPSTTAQSFTVLPYADWLDGTVSRGKETFVVRVTPAPSAGTAPADSTPVDVTITVDVAQLAPGQTPVAFTYKVTGYAGTRISVNFFPASGLNEGSTAPLLLQGSALGEPGNIDPYQLFDVRSHTPGTASLRAGSGGVDFNVITWDPRGSFASGGVYQLNDPFLDGVDVSRIVGWAAANTPTTLNGSGDPAAGMVGGSSGGEIQLVAAGIDPRIDAIAPATTWNSLIDSLQPHGVVNTSAASRMLTSLTKPEVRLNPQLRAALKDGVATGRLSEAALTLLANKNASTLLGQLQAPTLLWQSTSDPVFPLSQSMDTAQAILANPYGVPVKMGWFDGGAMTGATRESVTTQTVSWMAKYVAGLPIPDSFTPEFQWWDQTAIRHTSSLYPFSAGFNDPDPISATSRGGLAPMALTCAKPAPGLALRVPIPDGAQIAGVPNLQVRYRVQGKAQALCVRVTDASTGAILGSPTTPIRVVSDGKTRTVSLPLGGLSFTGQLNSALTVTVWGSTQPGVKPASVRLSVSSLRIDLPRHSLD